MLKSDEMLLNFILQAFDSDEMLLSLILQARSKVMRLSVMSLKNTVLRTVPMFLRAMNDISEIFLNAAYETVSHHKHLGKNFQLRGLDSDKQWGPDMIGAFVTRQGHEALTKSTCAYGDLVVSTLRVPRTRCVN